MKQSSGTDGVLVPQFFSKLGFFLRSQSNKASDPQPVSEEPATLPPPANLAKNGIEPENNSAPKKTTNDPLKLPSDYLVASTSQPETQNTNQPIPSPERASGSSGSIFSSDFDEDAEENPILDLYTDYFGLQARPFSLVPDPDFIFWSPAHRRAYTMLEYGLLTRSPITLITGEVGSGKTTLLHHLLKNIDDRIKVGLVANAQGSRGELLRWVLMALGERKPADANYVDLFESFQSLLIDEYAQGGRVVIIFDEAQNLSRESLEELRMFTNINSNKDELLQLVLVGQPELRDTIRRPDLRQFAQRVAANFHLGTMDSATVYDYIGHRLRAAGATKNLFHRTASDLIFEQTNGVPRLVNQLCDLAMVYTFTNNQKIVTYRTVQQVLDDGAFFGAGAFDNSESSI